MATWRAENSMLTKKGVEILNKIKAGIVNITITRIVAGSGRVAESQLINISQVSGTTKSMVLSKANTIDSGSEISIYIDNTGFTESFNLNQIGIYVSHPDYNEEQLYHISQCDENGFDVVPAFKDTPVNFGYSIFLEHGNSESIQITVDPQGAVRIWEFEEYKVSVENRITNLKYSDVGAAPYGNVDTRITGVVSSKDLDAKLDALLATMNSGSVRFVQVTFKENVPSLGGGNRIFQIDKIDDKYCVIHSLGYTVDSEGVVIETVRSKFNGVWSSWARVYNTFYKPTHLDVNAAPYSLIYGEESAVSKENLNSTLLEWFNSMDARQTHHFILNSSGGDGVLEGGTWFITIDKVGAIYGMITAKKYLSSTDVPGIMIKTCSVFDGQITNWGVLNSDALVPATLEGGIDV